MGLKEQQDLLARLYTDAELRSGFGNEPEYIGTRFSLTGPEINDLTALAELEVEWFADSLFWKRFRAVEKLLPTSSWIIGENFEPHFREFSREFSPTSVKKHLEDALAFSRWLLKARHLSAVAADVLKFESTRLRHNAEEKTLSVCTLAHDVRPIFDFGRPGSESEIQTRRSFAIWARVGCKTRFFFI